MPVWDAMTSIRSAMSSNSGPSVSAWSKRSSRRYMSNVTGSHISTVACGFSAMLRRVLLKNWHDSATCRGPT